MHHDGRMSTRSPGRLGRIASTMSPDGFHGVGRDRGHFEGWYFKLVSEDLSQRWAVIPGVFLAEDESGPHEAFVQVLDGSTGRSWYRPYPVADFEAAQDRLQITVGPNTFTPHGVNLHLDDVLTGRVEFTTALQPWPVTRLSPGIMGWYSWMPFMECYHGVTSFDHVLRGSLEHEGRPLDFDGGRGYIEKDWGQAFPAAYVWMQANHFATPGTSLVGSIATIPWLRSEFPGFIVGLWHLGQLHRFATYTGAKSTSLEVTDEEVRWTLRGGRSTRRPGGPGRPAPGHTLELRARRGQASLGGLLHAPIRTEMHKRVQETLDATISVTMRDRDGAVLFDETGRAAGLEVHGDISRLLAKD